MKIFVPSASMHLSKCKVPCELNQVSSSITIRLHFVCLQRGFIKCMSLFWHIESSVELRVHTSSLSDVYFLRI